MMGSQGRRDAGDEVETAVMSAMRSTSDDFVMFFETECGGMRGERLEGTRSNPRFSSFLV